MILQTVVSLSVDGNGGALEYCCCPGIDSLPGPEPYEGSRPGLARQDTSSSRSDNRLRGISAIWNNGTSCLGFRRRKGKLDMISFLSEWYSIVYENTWNIYLPAESCSEVQYAVICITLEAVEGVIKVHCFRGGSKKQGVAVNAGAPSL